jgi:hypothetical protein
VWLLMTWQWWETDAWQEHRWLRWLVWAAWISLVLAGATIWH